MSSETWPELIAQLLADHDLDAGQTNWAMTEIMAGQATPAQIAAFAVALRAKGETAAEVGGLVSAMLDEAIPLEIDEPTLDVVGTGGDQADTVNISTMSSVVAAAAGARVVKHGNRAASSQCGSADLLEAVGVAIELPAEGVVRCVDEVGIGFVFARAFHPAFRFVGPTRSEIGVPTVFNILGPLANPARPIAQFVGCANERLAPVMAGVLADRGTVGMVVRGVDGLDEVTVFDSTEVWDVRTPQVEHGSITLAGLGVTKAQPGALRGGDAAMNAQVMTSVFAGDTSGNLAAVRDAVALNAAGALVSWDAATGSEPASGTCEQHIAAALPRAYEAIDSGACSELLDRWIAASQQAAG